jgi:hypothetical protein
LGKTPGNPHFPRIFWKFRRKGNMREKREDKEE